MRLKCHSHITKLRKRSLAESKWPPPKNSIGVCNGDLTIKLRVVIGGPACCYGSPEIQVDVSCSRCSSPYHPTALALSTRANYHFNYNEIDVSDLLGEWGQANV